MKKSSLTIPEFCRIAGIGNGLGYRALKNGTLPVQTIRVGSKTIIPRRAVEELFGIEAVADALDGLRRSG